MTQTKPLTTSSHTRKWEPYPVYKDSGSEWLGEIPVHWEMKRLKYVIQNSLVNGLFKKKDQFGSGTKLINVVDLYKDNFLIDFDGLDRVETEQEEYETFKVLSGDIFFVRSSLKLEGVGSSASIIEVPEHTVFECHVVRIRPSSKLVISKYLINYLNSSPARQRLVALAETTTMTTISQPKLASLEVIVPPLLEQQTIAAFLDRETARINALIVKKEQLIVLLQEKRVALISHAVTKGLDPTVPMKDSGVEWLGEIPVNWEVRRLKFVVSEPLKYGANEPAEHADTNLPRFIRITDIDEKGSLRNDTFRSLPENIAKPYLLKAGDLLFARSGATVGKSFMYRASWGRACYAGYLIRARINLLLAIPEFVTYFTNTSMYRNWISSVFIQATIQNVNAEKYANLFVTIPPISEQYTIVAYVNHETAKIDALISRIRDGIEKLKEYSTALISSAVTGKIDVREGR